MGACFSRNTKATVLEPASQQPDLKSNPQPPQNTKNDQQVFKKEIFVIKHRISHEIDRHEDEDDPSALNPSSTPGGAQSRYSGGSRTRTSSCSKEEVDAILIHCGRLSRSNSAGSQNPNRRRRHTRSKRSYDFDLDTSCKNDDGDDEKTENDEALDHHHHRHREEVRVPSPSRMRHHRSCSKERGSGRRISISPSRRSESPFRSVNSGMSSNRPAKMVPVPATDKSNNGGGEQPVTNTVTRIHVKRNVFPVKRNISPVKRNVSPAKRNVSPARTNIQVFNDSPNKEQTNRLDDNHSRHRRTSLAEIDNNTSTTAHSGNPKMAAMVPPRTRRLSQDLDMNTETVCNRNPSPPSYASLLLEDIHNFHQKNSNGGDGGGAATAPPVFELPACVTKACSIMEAVADLNSSNFTGFREPNPGDPITREQKLSQLGGFQRELPKRGIGRGSRTAYSIADGKMVALT